MTLKIFADLHHSDLYYSLHMLFEGRLNFELYRPIGLDWFHEGYWKIAAPYNNAIDTVNQYLEISSSPWDQYNNLNGNHYVEDDVYHIFEPVHEYHQKAITFAKFKEMEFDIIMPTIVAHDKPYLEMQQKYHPKAKVIAQMGNVNQRTVLNNVLHSVPYTPRPGQNAVYYHQEIDHNLYKYQAPDANTKNMYSMVNCLPYAGIYNQYKEALTEVDMKAFGGGCPDGSLFGSKGVAEKMTEANIGWHLKPGDGFGHTAMGWFYSGRPVITKMSDVIGFGADAPKLFEPGVTCHDLEAHTFEENCRMIRAMFEPEANQAWCERSKQRFNEIINYDAEEIKIRDFLGRLL